MATGIVVTDPECALLYANTFAVSLFGFPDDPAHLAAQVWADLHGLVLLRMNLPDFPWPAPLEEMADQAVARLIILGDSPHVPPR